LPEDLLEQESRKRIVEQVSAHPGTHMRELQRRLDMSAGTLEYHLHLLVREGVLAQRRQGRYTRYYMASQVGRREKDVLALLRQDIPRRLCARLLMQPGQSHGELLQHFPIAPSTLSFHLKKLVDGGLVESHREGRETRFRVLEPDLVGKVLVDYKGSFVDELVDRFADVWLSVEAAVEEKPAPDAPAEDPGREGGKGATEGRRADEEKA
jgi:DNA-binding transcriptional ArsR family regulator